jgi:hypothetical protein
MSFRVVMPYPFPADVIVTALEVNPIEELTFT